jgi:hypothetical protein
MADSWHVTNNAVGVAFASAKHLLDIFNAAASTKTIKVYRIWVYNNYVATVTGVFTALQVKRTSLSSGGTTLTPLAHNLGQAALNANTTAGTGRTITASSIFRQILWQNDEPTVSTFDMDALLTLVPFCEVWNSGYGDSQVQPLTCRAGFAEGVTLQQPGSNTVGTCDVEAEFTSE